ncbi:MAG: hypothetical protein K8T25_19215 [Planctomycetia bacterium]|nr:hypothetical protein [Planctomycetia bacterium]
MRFITLRRAACAGLCFGVAWLGVGQSLRAEDAPAATPPPATAPPAVAPAAAAPAAAPAAGAAERSIDDVMQAFFIALLSNDEAGVKAEIMPHAKAEILWKGMPVPKQLLEQMKKQFKGLTCREVKLGDTIRLPGGNEVKANDSMINADSKLVYPSVAGEEMPIPLRMQKSEGKWKVDATPLIEARLASQRAVEGAGAQQPDEGAKK